MYCRKCGAQLADRSAVCVQCGFQDSAIVVKVPRKTLPPFRQELKSSIVLLVLAVLYLVHCFFYNKVSTYLHLTRTFVHPNFFNHINLFIGGLFWAVLSFSAAQRSFRITLLILIPYLLYHISWPFLNEYPYEAIFQLGFVAFYYWSALVLPFLVWGGIKAVHVWMQNCKHQWIFTVSSVIITVFIYCLYLVLCYSITVHPFSYALIIAHSVIAKYAINITICSLLLHFGHRE